MNSYIILAAGIGRNMKGVGCRSLIPITTQSNLIDEQIRSILKNDKNADIIVVAGFESQKLINYILNKTYDIRVVLNSNYATTSQVESLKLGINSCRRSSITIIHGDILFNENSIDFPDKKKSWITISDKSKSSAVGTVIVNGIVKNMSYGLENKWGQIAHFPKSKFDEIKSLANSIKTNRLTYEFINKLDFEIYPHCDESLEINRNYL
jgi:choline kinase